MIFKASEDRPRPLEPSWATEMAPGLPGAPGCVFWWARSRRNYEGPEDPYVFNVYEFNT